MKSKLISMSVCLVCVMLSAASCSDKQSPSPAQVPPSSSPAAAQAQASAPVAAAPTESASGPATAVVTPSPATPVEVKTVAPTPPAPAAPVVVKAVAPAPATADVVLPSKAKRAVELFEEIRIGMHRPGVEAILGKPNASEVERRGIIEVWYLPPPPITKPKLPKGKGAICVTYRAGKVVEKRLNPQL